MSCNVSQYLPVDDAAVAEVEDIIHNSLTAIPRERRDRRRRRSRGFLPPKSVELIVYTDQGQQLTLLAYETKSTDVYTELHRGDTKLRALHTHDGHRNPYPDNTEVDGCHMHFPSIKFALVVNKSSYAYELDCPDLHYSTDSVEFFCSEIGITIEGLQYLLGL